MSDTTDLLVKDSGCNRKLIPTRNQAGYIVGRDLPLLEQSSVAQYFLRRGHEKGLDEGQVKLFITGAERVYGPVPRDLRPKIEAAPLDHLVQWMSNMRTASTWSELISD